MKCYFGGSTTPFEYDFVEVCFAASAAEAKRIMWNKTDLPEECDHEWDNARVIRKPEFDHLIENDRSEAYIVRDDKTLRAMGWMKEGDNRCESCGLAEMEGEFPVCECGQCAECGCACDDNE